MSVEIAEFQLMDRDLSYSEGGLCCIGDAVAEVLMQYGLVDVGQGVGNGDGLPDEAVAACCAAAFDVS